MHTIDLLIMKLEYSSLIFLTITSLVHGFSAVNPAAGDSSLQPPKPPPSNIKIVGLPGGQIQTLPVQYVKSFPRWTLSEEDTGTTASLQQLRGTADDDNNAGFVNPTSIADLFWPSDISQLQIRPTLEILFTKGSPAYASGGVQVRVPPEASLDQTAWHNYGLSSQPLAHQWTTFGFTVEPNFRVELFVTDSNEQAKWKQLADGKNDTVQQMKNALEKLGVLLSNLDDTSPLVDGFHVVSIPTSAQWIDLERRKVCYQLVAMATAEPDAKELLSPMDEMVLALSATSILDVEVSQTEPGGKSQYLPEAYKPLYKGVFQ